MRIAPFAFAIITLAAPVASAQSVERGEAPSLVAWINEARAERNLAPLVEDPRLDALAERHSVDMASWGYFSHQSPRTGNVEDRAAAAGVGWRALGENIAFNQSTRQAHEALLRSPGHYANITGAYRSVGIGIVRSGDGVYVTEVFGTLTDAQPTQPAQTAPAAPTAPATPIAPTPPPRVATPRTAPRADAQTTPPLDDPWAAMGMPPFMQGWGIPWPSMQQPGARPSAPTAPRGGATARPGTRNCEVDTPFGHVTVSIAGDGIDTSGLPCDPDARSAPSQPQARPPATTPRPRAPARRAVPRVDVPPVPSTPMPPPSNEPLGAPVTI